MKHQLFEWGEEVMSLLHGMSILDIEGTSENTDLADAELRSAYSPVCLVPLCA